jgi:peptidoglycan/xylan/chitin deacetylase (PgdA/CDA1 family)
MKRALKRATLQVLKSTGVFRLVRNSAWRRHRLLILCYHSISQDDEHLWRPGLYVQPWQLEQHLEFLRQGEYNVLPLGEGLRLLREDKLPPRAVAITFDDGTYDFLRLGYPLLRRFQFPVTVYQTTYYTERPVPVFKLICSYLLWKGQGETLENGAELGLKAPLDLRSEQGRNAIVQTLMANCDRDGLNAWQRNEVACRLAQLLKVDYAEISARRILQLMTPEEISQLAREGVDFQLHTHRHCMPKDKDLFQKEIRDNRASLQKAISSEAIHFCYPSGVYSPEHLSWLAEQNVVSAVTCDVGLASRHADPFLLPRLVMTRGRTALEFEGWLTGVADFLALHRAAREFPAAYGD